MSDGYSIEGVCYFLNAALFNERHGYEEIKKHMESCDDCRVRLQGEFESYQKHGHDSGGTTRFPPNIASEDELLKQWVLQRAADDESEEFSEDQLDNALKNKEVQDMMEMLHHRLNRAVRNRFDQHSFRLPEFLLVRNVDLVEVAYRKLHDLMGSRAFWSWTGLDQHGDGDLERFIESWRKILLGEQK